MFVKEDVNNLPLPVVMHLENGTDCMEMITVTESVVLAKLSNLNVTKSMGPDQIHGKLLFELRHQLVGPLTKLFNFSLESGIVPQDWRDADVVPLFKIGSKKKVKIIDL